MPAIFGGLLIFWGLALTFINGSTSVTAYIPNMFGWFMQFLGVMELKAPKYKKKVNAYSRNNWIINILGRTRCDQECYVWSSWG